MFVAVVHKKAQWRESFTQCDMRIKGFTDSRNLTTTDNDAEVTCIYCK